MYNNDFFLTWQKSDEELAATFAVAEDVSTTAAEAEVTSRLMEKLLPAVFTTTSFSPSDAAT